MSFDSLFDENISYIRELSPGLANQLLECKAEVSITSISNRISIRAGNNIVSDDVEKDISDSLSAQYNRPDGISIPVVSQNGSTDKSSTRILIKAIHSTEQVFAQSLDITSPNKIDIPNSRSNYKTCLLLGSLSIVPLLNKVIANQLPAKTVILVESNLSILSAVLHIHDFSKTLKSFKDLGYGFHFIYAQSVSDLRVRILDLIATKLLLSLHGMQIFRSPRIGAELLSIHSWFHSPDELPTMVSGLMGFSTDEANQALNSVSSLAISKDVDINLINLSEPTTRDIPVLLVASGPSLDEFIKVLPKIQNKVVVVACGSSLAALTKAGIKVDYTVILERDPSTYYALLELVNDFPEIKDITLVSSITVDSRIPKIFKRSIFFSRPFALPTAIFPALTSCTLPIAGPHVINAALEIFLYLKIKTIVICGCDLGSKCVSRSRAVNAYDLDTRRLSIQETGPDGQTIFTSPDLLQVRSNIESLLSNKHFSNESAIFRIGYGLPVKSIKQLAVDDLYELLKRHDTSSNDELLNHQIIQTFSFSLSTKQQTDVLNQCLMEGNTYIDELLSTMNNVNYWHDSFYKNISKYLTRCGERTISNKNAPYHFYVPLLFFVFQPLYLSLGESDFRSSLKLAISNIKKIQGYYIALFNLFIEITNSNYPELYCDKGYIEYRLTYIDLDNKSSKK